VKHWIFIIFLLFSTSKLIANDILLEGKISYYYQTDSTTRKIMGNGVLYGLESSFQAYCGWYPWLSVSILPNSGHSIGERNNTTMYLVPIGVGLKYLYEFGCYSTIYVGAGALPAYLYTHDRAPVKRVRTKWDIGGIFKAGYLVDMNCFFLDIFLEYLLLTMNFSDTDKTAGRDADLSGLSAGGGIGYRF